MARESLEVGIIGFGRMGEHHCKKLGAVPELHVQSVCDPSEGRRALAESEYGLATYDDPAEFLSEDLDLVIVATHTGSHHEVGMMALDRGKHLLIEKPIATNAGEAGELVALARARGLALSVYHNRRWNGDYRRVKAVVESGALGELLYVENRWSEADPGHTFGTADFCPQWRIRRGMGGGALLDYGSHWFDQVLDLVPGRVAEVSADVRHVQWGDVDDYFVAVLKFQGGTRALVSHCNLRAVPLPKWAVHGSRASLVVQDMDAAAVVVPPAHGSPGGEAGHPVSLYKNLYDAIRRGTPLLVTGEQALRNALLIDACLRSAACGRSIAVDI